VRLLDADGMAERAVAVMSQTLGDTQRAFDSVAPDYDRSNAGNRMLCAMRARTLAAIREHVPAGSRIIDLGCGPGTDEETLAQAGHSVTAIDWSAAMVQETRKRIARAGIQDRVQVLHLGIHELDRLPPTWYDAACSNFGPLNCVPNLADAARLIGERVRPGGVLVASVIGRVCPWEIGLYALRGDWARLRIRFADGPVAVPLNGRTVWTSYYTPGEFEEVFAMAGFRRIALRALGLFVPPPYMEGFAARHQSLVSGLQQLEDFAGAWPGLRLLGDHFLVVLRKV
jgi:SAM-dependent methyltransferase